MIIDGEWRLAKCQSSEEVITLLITLPSCSTYPSSVPTVQIISRSSKILCIAVLINGAEVFLVVVHYHSETWPQKRVSLIYKWKSLFNFSVWNYGFEICQYGRRVISLIVGKWEIGKLAGTEFLKHTQW